MSAKPDRFRTKVFYRSADHPECCEDGTTPPPEAREGHFFPFRSGSDVYRAEVKYVARMVTKEADGHTWLETWIFLTGWHEKLEPGGHWNEFYE